MDIIIDKTLSGVSIYAISGDEKILLPSLWLRERASSDDQLDKTTNQRLFNSHELADDLTVVDATKKDDVLQVDFSDGCRQHYDMRQLENFCKPLPLSPKKVLWQNPPPKNLYYNFNQFNDSLTLLSAVSDYLSYGYIVMTNCPVTDKAVMQIGKMFGYIQGFHDGDFFEVYSKPVYNDLAYQPVALAPHSDMPYSNPQPGAQLLLCIINETSGGLSTLVDSLMVAEQLRQEDESAYQLLASVLVLFRYDNPHESIALERPIIEIDEQGNMQGARYSPRLDFMPLMDEDTTRYYQRARRRLGELFNDERFQQTFKLYEGECMMFDNSRVLHGRAGYNPQEGRRRLQGCYIRKDGPATLYRTLRRQQAGTLL